MHVKIRAYFKLVPLGVIERHLFGEMGVYCTLGAGKGRKFSKCNFEIPPWTFFSKRKYGVPTKTQSDDISHRYHSKLKPFGRFSCWMRNHIQLLLWLILGQDIQGSSLMIDNFRLIMNSSFPSAWRDLYGCRWRRTRFSRLTGLTHSDHERSFSVFTANERSSHSQSD